MEQYGRTAVARLVLMGLLAVFGGLAQEPGRMMAIHLADSSGKDMGSVYEVYMEQAILDVALSNPYACEADVMTPLTDFLTVESPDVCLEALALWSENQTAAEGRISTDRTAVLFYNPGAYYLELRVSMPMGRSRVVLVKLLVNEEGIG